MEFLNKQSVEQILSYQMKSIFDWIDVNYFCFDVEVNVKSAMLKSLERVYKNFTNPLRPITVNWLLFLARGNKIRLPRAYITKQVETSLGYSTSLSIASFHTFCNILEK